jgi:glycosyltransferase involved in cell wall biosynthesis
MSAPINKLSYGIVSNNIIKHLVKYREVFLSPIGAFESPTKEAEESAIRFLEGEVDICTNSLKIYHQFDLATHMGKGKHVGLPFFELDTLSQRDIAHMRLNDLIISPSKWGKEVINQNIPGLDCEVVPMGVDTSIFYPKHFKRGNKCVFLNIGKLEKRKGHDVLLNAAERVFAGRDDVSLWMMAGNKFISESQYSEYVRDARSRLGDKVAFLPHVESDEEVASIINRADFGVYPYRAEGFCLPLLESMACGLKVIATNYSAPTEYLTKDNALLIEPEGLEPAVDNIFFNGEGNWARLGNKSEDQLAEHMDFCYNTWKNEGPTIDMEAWTTASNLTWKKTAKGIAQHV